MNFVSKSYVMMLKPCNGYATAAIGQAKAEIYQLIKWPTYFELNLSQRHDRDIYANENKNPLQICKRFS